MRDEQRICNLDSVNVHFRVTHPERARATDAAVSGEKIQWRLLPHPQPGNDTVERTRYGGGSALSKVPARNDIERDWKRALRSSDSASRDNDTIEHAHRVQNRSGW